MTKTLDILRKPNGKTVCTEIEGKKRRQIKLPYNRIIVRNISK